MTLTLYPLNYTPTILPLHSLTHDPVNNSCPLPASLSSIICLGERARRAFRARVLEAQASVLMREDDLLHIPQVGDHL